MTNPRDLEGRHAIVTGANTGIGRVTAESLAARGASVVLACRSAERTQPVVDAIVAAGGDARFIALDLGDLASVRACAQTLLDEGKPIHILVNNAGIAGKRGLTKDGYELTFGTNHLGPFLFSVLLSPLLVKGAPSRIVNVASTAHYDAKGIDFDALRTSTRTITGLDEYAVSKLANVLFAEECQRRLGPKGVDSYSLHPGVVASDVWRNVPWGIRSIMKLFMLTNEQGAATSLYCATEAPAGSAFAGSSVTSVASAESAHRYYDKCKARTPSKLAQDESLARVLWEKSVAMNGADL